MVNFEQRYADTTYFQDPGSYIFNSFPTTTAYDFYHPGTQNYQYNTAQQNDYSAFRYDTYHEFSYTHQYFNFLSLTPRVGGRFTYYSDDNSDITDTVNNNGETNDKVTNPKARLAADAGLSGDFKVSRTWINVKIPDLGINGIRHVFEPYFDSEFAPSPTVTPNQIRGFDDRLYSTQLQPLDWTDYNSIDSLDKEAVVRFGAFNKIQTKRDGANYDLLSWQTYADADFDHNFSAATPGRHHERPVQRHPPLIPTPQFQFRSFSAVAVTQWRLQRDRQLAHLVAESVVPGHHRRQSHQPQPVFQSGNDATLAFFYRMNEHWQFETQHQFDVNNQRLQLQQYTIYRDLDAWKLALTFADGEENGKGDESVFFTLTLKAFPQYNLHSPHL